MELSANSALEAAIQDSETGTAKQDELAEMRKRLAALEAAVEQGQDQPKDNE